MTDSKTTSIFRPAVAPNKAGDGALIVFPNGSRGVISLDDIQGHIEDLKAIQKKLAINECRKIARPEIDWAIDGAFRRVFEGGAE